MSQIHLYLDENVMAHSLLTALIIPQQKYSIGDYLRAIIKFVNKYTAVNVRNQIYFLSNLL
jgi:hypothetical protein